MMALEINIAEVKGTDLKYILKANLMILVWQLRRNK